MFCMKKSMVEKSVNGANASSHPLRISWFAMSFVEQ